MTCVSDAQMQGAKFKVQSPQSSTGFSLLDLLITLMVLALVLLAAVNQFNVYDRPAAQPAPQAQSAPSQQLQQ